MRKIEGHTSKRDLGCQEPAFDLYKSSFAFVRDLYWNDGEKITDHGRVNRERKIGDRHVPADWFTRVDRLTGQMLERIDALPDKGAYKDHLRQGALVISYLSKTCGLQLGAEGDTSFLAEWKRMDPVSFDKLRADNAVDRVQERAVEAPNPVDTRPGRTVMCDGTTIQFYPSSAISRGDERISGTANGERLGFEYFRTSPEYYYDISYVWFAADGPVRVDLTVDVPIKHARLRTVLKDIPLEQSGSNLHFSLPGPGHYYLQLPDLGQPEPGNPDSGTYTVLFIIDDLTALKANRPHPNAGNIKEVTQHGVIPDLTKDQTDAIQRLVASAGDIYFPPGMYRAKTLRIPSNTRIYLAPGALIKAPDGISVDKGAPFLSLADAQNVRISGPGTIDGNGYQYHLVQTKNSRDITIEDALFRNCGSWAIHLLLVDRAVCRNVRILSDKDGIDPDCAKNVAIESCLIMSKDDSIAVKTRKPPATTERVTVRNCIVASDASALKVGTETRALIKNILFQNCEVFDSDRGIVIYARDGGPIENVTWRNIHMSLVHWPHETGGRPFTFEITERGGITPVRNCLVENVVTNTIVSSSLSGLPDAMLDGVTFHSVAINAETPHMGSSGKKPYLFWVGHHVDTRIHGLKIDWQDNKPLWAGVSSGPGLQIYNVQE